MASLIDIIRNSKTSRYILKPISSPCVPLIKAFYTVLVNYQIAGGNTRSPDVEMYHRNSGVMIWSAAHDCQGR